MAPAGAGGVAAWLALGLGLGLVPLLPGSAGALAGVPLALACARLGPRLRAAVIALLLVAAGAIAHYGSAAFAARDDPRIVVDELLAFPVATAALPIRQRPGLLAAAFVTSRVLDGLKPPPARRVERLPGAAAIVLDDVIANLYTLLLLAGTREWLRRRRRTGP